MIDKHYILMPTLAQPCSLPDLLKAQMSVKNLKTHPIWEVPIDFPAQFL
jgi:hypothetical protein